MRYKVRTSQSNTAPVTAQALQSGILLHFNIEQHTNTSEDGEQRQYYTYTEIYVPVRYTLRIVQHVCNKEGFTLTPEQISVVEASL